MLKHTFDSLFSVINSEGSVFGVYNDEDPNSTKISLTAGSGHSELWYGHMKVKQFAITRPFFFGSYISESVANQYPDLLLLFRHKKVDHSEWSQVAFESFNGDLVMQHFSKSSHYNFDLYHNLVAPGLKSALDVETWRHGNSEPSICRLYPVKNIVVVGFSGYGLNFSSMHDHAKWAVTVSPDDYCYSPDQQCNPNWTCLGDINRQVSQYYRGGGTMCIQDNTIWKAFKSLIMEVEECR